MKTECKRRHRHPIGCSCHRHHRRFGGHDVARVEGAREGSVDTVPGHLKNSCRRMATGMKTASPVALLGEEAIQMFARVTHSGYLSLQGRKRLVTGLAYPAYDVGKDFTSS